MGPRSERGPGKKQLPAHGPSLQGPQVWPLEWREVPLVEEPCNPGSGCTCHIRTLLGCCSLTAAWMHGASGNRQQGRPGQQDLWAPRLGRCQATGSCHGSDMGECRNLRGERE